MRVRRPSPPCSVDSPPRTRRGRRRPTGSSGSDTPSTPPVACTRAARTSRPNRGPRRPVVDDAAAAVAPLPAPPELAVERVQHLAVHPAQRQPAELRMHVILGVTAVRLQPVLVDVHDGDVPIWFTVARVFAFQRSST